MSVVKLIALHVGVLSVALFWAWISIVKMLFGWVRNGNKYWEVKERSLPPKCLQDPQWGKHSQIKLKGIKLHYVENGDPQKPLMLFVHGFPEFWYSWRHQLKYFAKSHWVVALDMRGYGDSEKPPKVSDYNYEVLQKDIVDLVKGLGRNSCTLVAHDWGGAVAWSVAANFPDIVTKLIILNAPHPTAFQRLLRSSFVQFLKSWYIFMFQLPFLPELGIFVEDLSIFPRIFGKTSTEEDLEAYKYTFGQKSAWTPPINYYRSSMRQNLAHLAYGTGKQLPKIKMPTLIIWGEDDLALDKSIPEKSRPFIDNLRIEFIKGGNHFIQTDKPEAVNKLIESFL